MKASTILFFVGSVIILIVGALAFRLVTKPVTEINEQMTVVASTSPAVPHDSMTGSGSILSVMSGAEGKSIECTFVFTGSTTRSEGTGFFSDGKSRVDTLYTDDQNNQVASYMIMNTGADTLYVWSLVDGEQSGMKMSISANKLMAAKVSANKPSTKLEQISPESDVQYTCKPWLPDTTVFIPPTDVSFTDMAEMNNMMDKMMDEVKLPANQ